MTQQRAHSPLIINDDSITGDVYSNSIFPRGRNGFSLTYDWNSAGNLVAALYLQCRNDENESWATCNNAVFPSAPDGSAGNDEYAVVDTVHKEYRVWVDFTSGDGELLMRVNMGE